jgi:1-deoxy-D-xylulose-5-phosphate synthase
MSATALTGPGLLETIREPDDLRAFSHSQLDSLAGEIRGFLVDSVAATGGHLGSNLGVVELTLALHRVFASPSDALVWDTGHQAYVHKMITGRAPLFGGLRQPNGLSGYPNRAESAHDVVENSHASTALSYAHGLATARDLRGGTDHVVAIVGDGALTGGLAFEALNNLGTTGRRVIVVLNDNGRSYAPTRSRLSTALSGDCPAPFFEALGVSYIGPVDGHHIESTEQALHAAARRAGPVVVHVITRKGRGYEPAERDLEKCLHDTAPFDAATGVRNGRAASSYTDAFSEALVRIAADRPDVVAITAAMPGSTGLLAFQARYPDRFFDVGIAEQHAVTMAAGLAMGGLRPVVAIYATFLNRAWDQVYYDVGLHQLPVVFCLDRAGVTGDDGPSHHGLVDLALLTKVPGMTVLAPSSYEDIGDMLEFALRQPGPVAIRWPKTPARHRERPFPVGSVHARRTRIGGDVCFLGVGKLVAACEGAADLLAAQGINATVWDVQSAMPLDESMIRDALSASVVVTAEDGVVEGGVGAHATAALHRAAICAGSDVPRVAVCGIPVAYLAQGKSDDMLRALGLDANALAALAEDLYLAPRAPATRLGAGIVSA